MKLTKTPIIERCLQKFDRPYIDETKVGDSWIEYRTAISLGKSMGIPLAEFFKGTSVWTQPPPIKSPTPKTAEYIQLMERLRREESERQYRELLGSADTNETLNISAITKDVNSQLTTIFNVLVSIVAVAWAFWYWCSSWSLPARTLTSLFAGIFVGIAEVVVFAGYQRRLAEAKQRKTPAEEPKIIKRLVFDGGKTIEKTDDKMEKADGKMGKADQMEKTDGKMDKTDDKIKTRSSEKSAKISDIGLRQRPQIRN